MRKLDLRNYEYTEAIRNPVTGAPDKVALPVYVKDSIVNMMFLPRLGLAGAELIKQNMLAVKIESAGDEVILEEEEYNRIKASVETYPAEGRAFVELVDRVLNKTPEIEMKEA